MKRLFRPWIPAFAGMTKTTTPQSSPRNWRSKVIYFILTVIILFGAFLRFYAVNWDSFNAFHPDERNISWAVTRIHFFSEMNPKFFAYGGLPIYLYRALGEGVVFITKNNNWLFDWGHIAVIGRYVSAVLSTISIYLIFLVGSVYFNQATGLTSAAFLAFSPWAIEQAHFDTTETMLVFFVLLLLVFSYKLLRSIGNTSVLIALGIIWGLAIAAKTTAALFGVIPLAAIWAPKFFKTFFKNMLRSLLLGVTALVVFFLFSPYTVLDYKDFYTSMTYESGVALGRFTVPYTLQFWHTPAYLYPIITMLWQTGPLVIVGLAGLIAILIAVMADLIRHPLMLLKGSRINVLDDKNNLIVFVIFPLIYFGWVGSWYTKFARYNVPFLPFVTLAAAWLMIVSLQKLKKNHVLFYISLFVYSLICLLTLAWCLATFTVYLRPQTRILASNWIYANIPSGAHIYTEHWNDGLPLDSTNGISYNRELLTVYDLPDGDAKRTYYADNLSSGDYIILSTRRIWATMPRLTEKYPVTSLFYKKLLAGELGYTEIATFTSYPQFFGKIMNDDSAEESVAVFDHPTVRIFKNTSHFSKTQLVQLLTY